MENVISNVWRCAQGSEDRTCVPHPLRPAPLFRSIGLTGVSDSLPPHRRLRAVLQRGSAVLPARAKDKDTTRSCLTSASQGRFPLNGLKSSSSHIDNISDSCEFLPDIVRLKPQAKTDDEKRSRRESHAVKEMDVLDCSRFQAQEDFCLKSSNRLTERFLLRHSTGHNLPLKSPISRRTIVFPLTQSDTGAVTITEGPARTIKKRWKRRVSNTPAFSQSEHGLDEGMNDIRQGFHSLTITSEEKDHSSTNRRESQTYSFPNERGSHSRGSGVDGEHEGAGACHIRRDRRPHFLPPISHLGCLLDVPFILPENSPPPSPSCSSSPAFFPLHVPTPPMDGPNGHRDT